MEERRKTPRNRALKGAKIAFNHHSSVIDCTVRNLTAVGALIKVPSTVGIPDRFDMKLQTDSTFRPCQVKWRNEDSLGVEFT